MSKVKKILGAVKYLLIGGVLGGLQQELGGLDQRLWHGGEGFQFSYILGSLGFWALAILLLIFRERSPKEQFRDILLLFVGLDFVYYVWQFFNDMRVVFRFPDRFDGGYVLQLLGGAAVDFLMYTGIGAAAAVWGMAAVKLRMKGRKRLYSAMLVPLFLVLVNEVGWNIFATVRYYFVNHMVSTGELVLDGVGYSNALDGLVISAVMLGLAAVFFVKDRRRSAI